MFLFLRQTLGRVLFFLLLFILFNLSRSAETVPERDVHELNAAVNLFAVAVKCLPVTVRMPLFVSVLSNTLTSLFSSRREWLNSLTSAADQNAVEQVRSSGDTLEPNTRKRGTSVSSIFKVTNLMKNNLNRQRRMF